MRSLFRFLSHHPAVAGINGRTAIASSITTNGMTVYQPRVVCGFTSDPFDDESRLTLHVYGSSSSQSNTRQDVTQPLNELGNDNNDDDDDRGDRPIELLITINDGEITQATCTEVATDCRHV